MKPCDPLLCTLPTPRGALTRVATIAGAFASAAELVRVELTTHEGAERIVAGDSVARPNFLQEGFLTGAAFGGVRAARSKSTATGRIERTRRFTFEDVAVYRRIDVGFEGRA